MSAPWGLDWDYMSAHRAGKSARTRHAMQGSLEAGEHVHLAGPGRKLEGVNCSDECRKAGIKKWRPVV